MYKTHIQPDSIADMEPSLEPRESYRLYMELLRNIKEWVPYYSDTHSEVYDLIYAFINTHAKNGDGKNLATYTFIPIAAGKFFLKDNKGFVVVVVYSNGAVVGEFYEHSITWRLWIDKTTAETFHYPLPQ